MERKWNVRLIQVETLTFDRYATDFYLWTDLYLIWIKSLPALQFELGSNLLLYSFVLSIQSARFVQNSFDKFRIISAISCLIVFTPLATCWAQVWALELFAYLLWNGWITLLSRERSRRKKEMKRNKCHYKQIHFIQWLSHWYIPQLQQWQVLFVQNEIRREITYKTKPKIPWQ